MTRGDMGLTERRRRLSVRGLLFVILGLLFVGALSVHATAGDPAAEVPLDGSESACSCKDPTLAADNRSTGSEFDDGLGELTGPISDCCCDYETVNKINEEHLQPVLSKIVKQPFFHYFKLDFHCECPFWPDDGMCSLKDCSVCECQEDEIPLGWKKPKRAQTKSEEEASECSESSEREGKVDRSMNESGSFLGWRELDNPWTAEDESSDDHTYVNLLLNPERYTGYAGDHAHRVWSAIYAQSCFEGMADGFCSGNAPGENRMFYKLVSGVHASISAHIAREYLLDRSRDVWGRNYGIFRDRLAAYPNRIQNLYFTALFVLRAVVKAGPFLRAADFSTGNPEADAQTLVLVTQLVQSQALHRACPLPFDEVKLLHGTGDDGQRELQKAFRNVSAVMDCVGCEKCKLWGKLQVLGLGTALKILFSQECPDLARTEVIALVNLLYKLSSSIALTREYAAAVRAGTADGPLAGTTPSGEGGRLATGSLLGGGGFLPWGGSQEL